MELYHGDLTSIIEVIIGALLVAFLIVALVGYIFQSIGLYTMAKKRMPGKAFWAWIPFGQSYVMGSLARQTSIACGTKTYLNMRVILPVCQGVSLIIIVAASVITYITGSVLYSAALNLFTSVLGIGLSVLNLVCLYGVLKGYDKKNSATTHIILSVFIPIYQCIILFVFRNREFIYDDDGSRQALPVAGGEAG